MQVNGYAIRPNADLSGANLSGAYLRYELLKGARIEGVLCSDETQWPEGFDPFKAGVVCSPQESLEASIPASPQQPETSHPTREATTGASLSEVLAQMKEITNTFSQTRNQLIHVTERLGQIEKEIRLAENRLAREGEQS